MEERLFTDKTIKPTEEAIKLGFGNVYSYYCKINDITVNYSKDWNITSTGWILKVWDKKKALFYIIPLNNELKITMTIRENERNIFLGDIEMECYYEILRSAKKYVEGYALQFFISNNIDYERFEALIRKLIEYRN